MFLQSILQQRLNSLNVHLSRSNIPGRRITTQKSELAPTPSRPQGQENWVYKKPQNQLSPRPKLFPLLGHGPSCNSPLGTSLGSKKCIRDERTHWSRHFENQKALMEYQQFRCFKGWSFPWTELVQCKLRNLKLQVRFGLKDETIQPVKENFVEPGTDTRNKCYGDWNVSTQPLLPRDHERKTRAE